MWIVVCEAQIDGRYFPLSDHHIRGFSIIGEAERTLELFQQLYNRNPSEFQLEVLVICCLWLLGVKKILALCFNSCVTL